VIALVDDEASLAKLSRDAFGQNRAGKTGADN
jgi:hypothetical protein